jgi:hypothetical protein
MSKEKPILFSTPMVKAILADRKSKTRRLNRLKEINENPNQWDLDSFEVDPELMAWDKNGDCYPLIKKGLIATFTNNEYGEVFRNIKCPWEVGDVLWVRETWQYIPAQYDGLAGILSEPTSPSEFIYRADGEMQEGRKWRSPRYMPRKAARLFLEVKDIQPERLCDITEEDAKAEGCELNEVSVNCNHGTASTIIDLSVEHFINIWDSINSKRGYGWDINPWDWVVEFARIKL